MNNCVICNKDITNRRNAKYCKECYQEINKQNATLRRLNKVDEKVRKQKYTHCAKCNKKLINRHENSKYCKECAILVNIENTRKRYYEKNNLIDIKQTKQKTYTYEYYCCKKLMQQIGNSKVYECNICENIRAIGL